MQEFIETLHSVFEENRNPENALQQKAYMRNQFEFFGLGATLRKELSKPFLLKQHLPAKEEAFKITRELWTKAEREYQYFAIDLLLKYIKKLKAEDIEYFEYIITHKSWWDTVDAIADKMLGAYFLKFPKKRMPYIDKWLASENIWLQRTTLLFQLKYKEQLDTEILTHCIHALLGSDEFFINKAIGWILRQYSRSNPEWVLDFVEKTELQPLSRKEALRLIK